MLFGGHWKIAPGRQRRAKIESMLKLVRSSLSPFIREPQRGEERSDPTASAHKSSCPPGENVGRERRERRHGFKFVARRSVIMCHALPTHCTPDALLAVATFAERTMHRWERCSNATPANCSFRRHQNRESAEPSVDSHKIAAINERAHAGLVVAPMSTCCPQPRAAIEVQVSGVCVVACAD